MADTNPAGQNLSAPLPTGQPPKNRNHRKRYLAALAAILVVAIGLGAYFIVGGKLFKGFIGEEYVALKECVEGLPEEVLINSEYPVTVNDGCTVDFATADGAKFVYAGFGYEQDEDSYGVTFTAETNLEDARTAWYIDEAQLGIGSPKTVPFAAAGSYEVEMRISGEVGGKSVELVNTKTVVVTETVVVTDPVGGASDPTFSCIQTAETLNVECTAADTEGTHKWNFGTDNLNDGQSTETHTYTAPGNYTITHEITKNDTSESTSIEFTVVAPEAPVPPDTSFECTPIEGGPAPLTITCTAVAFGANYYWDFGDGSEPVAASDGTTITHIYTNAGNYMVGYSFMSGPDELPVLSLSPTIIVTAGTPTPAPTLNAISAATPGAVVGVPPVTPAPLTPPVANFSFNMENVYVSATSIGVTFTDLSTSADNIVNWEWDWDDISPNDTYQDKVDTKDHHFQYSQNGPTNYTVTLTITNAAGATAQHTETVTITAPEPLVALPGCSQVETPLTISCNVGNSTGDFTDIHWNFGDNQFDASNNETVQHTYEAADTYTVELNLTATYGSATATTEVIVAECADGLCGTPPPADSETVLLLHFDNSAVEDSSSYENVMLNSMADISDVDPKIGTYSASFNGTSSTLSLTNQDDILTFGAEDWTIDYWVKTRNVNQNQVIFWIHDSSDTPVVETQFYSGVLQLYINARGDINVNGYQPTLNTWEHHAVVRSGNNIKVFVNGDEKFDQDMSYAMPNGSMLAGQELVISYPSAPLFGFIDEFRIVKGRAVWTENFTPPTAPYEVTIANDTWNSRIASMLTADAFHSTLDDVPELPANVFTAEPDNTIKLITFAEPQENAVFVRFNGKQWDLDVGEPSETCEITPDQALKNMAASAGSNFSLQTYFSATQIGTVETIVNKIKQLIPVVQELIQKGIELLQEAKTLVTLENINQIAASLNMAPPAETKIAKAIEFIDLLIAYGNKGLLILEGNYETQVDNPETADVNESDSEMVANINYAVKTLLNLDTDGLYRLAFVAGPMKFKPEALDDYNCRQALRDLEIADVVNGEGYTNVYVDVTQLPEECLQENSKKGETFDVKMLEVSECSYLPDELIIQDEVAAKINTIVDEILEDKNALIDILDRIKGLVHEFNQDENKNLCTAIGNTVELGEYFKDTYFENANWPPIFFEHINTAQNSSVEIEAPYLSSDDFGITALAGDAPENGALENIDDDTIKYTPNDGFEGFDGFMYLLTPSEGSNYSAGNLRLFDYIRGLILGERFNFSDQKINGSFAITCIEVGGEEEEKKEEEKKEEEKKEEEKKEEEKKEEEKKEEEKKEEEKKEEEKKEEVPQGPITITELSAKAIDAEKNPDPDKEGKIPLQFAYKTEGVLNSTDQLAWYLKNADGDALPYYEVSKKAANEPVIAWYAPGEYSYRLEIRDENGKVRAEKLGGQILIVFKETGTPEPEVGTKAGDTKEIAIKIIPEVVVGDIEPIVIPIVIETTIVTKEITETVTVEGGGGGGTSYSQCSDNQNNDDDNFIDFPADPGCNNADDNTESPDPVTRIVTQCADGIDNDKNGVTDYPEDKGCINENDNSEETKTEFIASLEGVPGTEMTNMIMQANNCLSKTPQNKITILEDISLDHPAAEMIANLQKLAYNGEPIIMGRQIKGKYYFEAAEPIFRSEAFKVIAGPSCVAQSATAKGLWDTKKVKNYKDKELDGKFWAEGFVNALTNLGMVEGYGDGRVGVNKPITRAEFLKLLLDAYALRVYFDEHDDIDFTTYDKETVLKEVFADSLAKYKKNPFPDISELNKPWFSNYAIIAYDLELTKGIENLFNGGEEASRDEAATMVYNFFIAKIKQQQAEAVEAGVETVKEITFIRTFMSPRYGSF